MSDENVERARALALEFDLTYLRERNTCASEAEARTAGWLAVARASRPREAGKVETKPEVVCLCGSTRFIDTFQAEYGRLTDEGKIVLTVGRVVPQSEQALGSTRKVALDALHLRKIDLADRVLVLNVGGYVGPSTRREIAYAKECGKPIDLLYPDAGLDGLPPPVAPEACPVRWIACPNGDHYDERAVTTEVEAEAMSHADTMNSDAPDDEEWGVIPLYAQPASATADGGSLVDAVERVLLTAEPEACPVARVWIIVDRNNDRVAHDFTLQRAEEEATKMNRERHHSGAGGPYRVVPLYAAAPARAAGREGAREACPRLRWLAEMLDRHAQIENGDPENGPSLDSSRLADEIAARFATPASAAGGGGGAK